VGGIAVIGDEARVGCFALVGVRVLPAGTPGEVARAWADLPPGTELVLLTAAAVAALGEPARTSLRPLVAVLP
jgi:vacuolar-type H+-ATPase subunit F/Vma7